MKLKTDWIMKPDYRSLIKYCKDHELEYAVIDDRMALNPEKEFCGLQFINTETYSIVDRVMVVRGLVVNIRTPQEVRPDCPAAYYSYYQRLLTELSQISKPSYLAAQDTYTKLMCWCERDNDTFDRDFFKLKCEQAIQNVKREAWYNGEPLDFRVQRDNEPSRDLFTLSELDQMYEAVQWLPVFDCELHVSYNDHDYKHAETADHGVYLFLNKKRPVDY